MKEFKFTFKDGILIYENMVLNIGIITPIEETPLEKEPYFYIKDNHGDLLASITGDDKETLEVERDEFIAWVDAKKEKIEEITNEG